MATPFVGHPHSSGTMFIGSVRLSGEGITSFASQFQSCGITGVGTGSCKCSGKSGHGVDVGVGSKGVGEGVGSGVGVGVGSGMAAGSCRRVIICRCGEWLVTVIVCL